MEVRDIIERLQQCFTEVKSLLLDSYQRFAPRLQRAGAFCNRFLPFTDPSTPLLQDIIHTLVFCTILYFAPVLLERHTERYIAEQNNRAPPQPVPERQILGDGRQQPHVEDEVEEVIHHDGATANGEVLLDDLQQGDNAANDINAFGEGPANNAANQANAAHTTTSRNVGKKKAASLARKDQRRAYHEFHRAQGDAQRARDREIEIANAAAAAEERARREAAEAEVVKKAEDERKRNKEEIAKAREREMARRRAILDAVYAELEKGNKFDLKTLVVAGEKIKVEEVEKLAKAEGILGSKYEKGVNTLTLVTKTGWLVRVTENHINSALANLGADVDASGTEDPIPWSEVGRHLEITIADDTSLPADQTTRDADRFVELNLGRDKENPLQEMMKGRWG